MIPMEIETEQLGWMEIQINLKAEIKLAESD